MQSEISYMKKYRHLCIIYNFYTRENIYQINFLEKRFLSLMQTAQGTHGTISIKLYVFYIIYSSSHNSSI